MRALIVSCVFPPEPVVSAQTSADTARSLADRGCEVTVITAFPNRPAGKLFPGYSRRLYQWSQFERGIKLLRCFATLSTGSKKISRFFENISFGVTSGLAALFMPRPDVIYSNTWPLFASGLIFLVARLRNVPMVISVQDIYPESLLYQEGLPCKNWLVRLLRRVDGMIARHCRAVIVISNRFADLYRVERRVPPERVHVVPNWGDGRTVRVETEQLKQFRETKGIPRDALVFAYGGNIGVAAGVETLIRALPFLKKIDGFRLLIAGEGSQLNTCRALARDLNDGRLLFHTPWRTEETGLVLGLADVLLLPTRGRQSQVSVPSKLIAYWLAGKPVIALAWPNSDLADILERSGGGWLVEPDRPDLLAARIQEVLGLSPAELNRRGEAGSEFAQRNFTREICLPRVIHILEQAVVK